MHDLSINVEHVTRVEGHGSIVVDVKDGEIKKCQWQVVEAPRFFEAMVRGRKWDELAHITSRICGICSVGHTMASLKATEAAMGVTPSEQTITLRKILKHAENFQSHVLHVGYLVLPEPYTYLKQRLPVLPLNELDPGMRHALSASYFFSPIRL